MFNIKFDFDYEKFSATKVKEYHFTESTRNKIQQACRELAKFSRLLATTPRLKSRLVDVYFGRAYELQLNNQLQLLDNVINNGGMTVTFVDGSPRRVRVKVNPNNLDAPQKIMDKPYSKKVMAGAVAWVHTLPGTGAARKPGDYHVGSGYRIILGKAFSPADTLFYIMGMIYHELSHKVLGTNDHCYGETNCLGLKGTPRAIKNADNFNYFLQKFASDYNRGLRV